jgi:thymidylate synthase
MNILVFQERGSGEHKIEGVRSYGEGVTITEVVSIDVFLPDFIDDPEEIIKDDFSADLVLNFLKHPDLVEHLIALCEQKGIPIVSAGKKGAGFTPFTCCGLGKNETLGIYGDKFGLPEYKVVLQGDVIKDIEVIRGAPCGATWDALQEYIGCQVDDVLVRLPRQVQYFCSADPSGFDPVSGKSPVHFAGYVHIAALKKAIEEAQ